MRSSVFAVFFGALVAAGSGWAESSECKVRVGHERPRGCAPFRAQSVKASRPEPKQAEAPPAPDEPWMQSIREPPQQAARKQSERLLIQELVKLERLLVHTPKGAPERLSLIKRLADGYAELEALAKLRRLRASFNLEQAQRESKAGVQQSVRRSPARQSPARQSPARQSPARAQPK